MNCERDKNEKGEEKRENEKTMYYYNYMFTHNYLAPRSGLAWKNHIDVGAGVIDCDYRGNVGVVLFNHSDVDFNSMRHPRTLLDLSSFSIPNYV
jgi:hypothetical protein